MILVIEEGKQDIIRKRCDNFRVSVCFLMLSFEFGGDPTV